MNYMQEVAKLLGVELYENFRYESTLTGLSKIELRFTEKYLEGYSPDINAWFNVKFETICNLLNGEYEVVKLPKNIILTEQERKYLSAVIKPFRNRIKYFYKWTCADCNYEQIVAACTDYSHLAFPAFEKNSMYKDMEPNKKYTLGELGL